MPCRSWKKQIIIKKKNYNRPQLMGASEEPCGSADTNLQRSIISGNSARLYPSCRFCQRECCGVLTEKETLHWLWKWPKKTLQATAMKKYSLLSLSSGDYSCLEPLVKNLMNKYHSQRVAVALPSLRVESLTGTLMERNQTNAENKFYGWRGSGNGQNAPDYQ